MKVVIKSSTNPKKKYMAIFFDDYGKKKKTTYFGQAGALDFIKSKGDKERKKRYLNRHRVRENWNDFMSAGSLSRWILWNKPTLKASISDYKKKFNLL